MNFIDKISEIEKLSFTRNDNDFDGVVVLPPPNITGKLHIGHALNAFIQDLRIRFEKLHGRNILWIPGTDHSGIATQILVEKSISPVSKHELGREKFLEKVWEWKEKYQHNIYDQLKSLGLLLNWDYAKFTMDSDIQFSVSKAFCELYEHGLIYKAKKIIYWDVELETAISDLEVKSEEVKGNLYYIQYELESSSVRDEVDHDEKYIMVATTRPETMFGDQAVAVNPRDKRYAHLVGCFVRIPLSDRSIQIIADERCEIETGTGAVKITPAHDFLDFEIGQTHNLKYVNVIDEKGRMCGEIPEKYVGLDRFEVRKLLENDLGSHLIKIEHMKHVVPKGDRSGTILEPRLTNQWFIDTADLAKLAMSALQKIKIYPDYFVNTYKHWINNIQPWCISRQLWWGHRIPVWYCEDHIIVAMDQEEAEKKAMHFGLQVANLKQDEDVLDTWFSSGLWPFTTIENNKLDPHFYPNEFLVTGSDILFFWVARMIMFGCFLKKDVPFKELYLHGLVQDNFGKKMSKSKNNVVDPMEVVAKEGKDVLRFALLYSSIPGKNIKFGDKNVEHARHFCIKIWNLYKYIKNNAVMQNDVLKTNDIEINHIWNIWIMDEIEHVIVDIERCIREWDLYHAAHKIYKMVWDTFCNWYLEGAKYLLNSEYAEETKYVLMEAMRKILISLHPFIPFLTAYIYKDLFNGDILNVDLSRDSADNEINCDNLVNTKPDNYAKRKIDFVKNVVEAVRFVRAEFMVGKEPILHVAKLPVDDVDRYGDVYVIIKQITKCDIRIANNAYDRDCISYPVLDGFLSIPISNFDAKIMHDRLNKMQCSLQNEYDVALAKCNDHEFMTKAPSDVRDEMMIRIRVIGDELKKIDNLIKMMEYTS